MGMATAGQEDKKISGKRNGRIWKRRMANIGKEDSCILDRGTVKCFTGGQQNIDRSKTDILEMVDSILQNAGTKDRKEKC
jgi:hypothetical protein